MGLFSRKELIMICHLGTSLLIIVTLWLDDAYGETTFLHGGCMESVACHPTKTVFMLKLKFGNRWFQVTSSKFFFFLFLLPAHSLSYPGFCGSNYTCQGKSARLPWSTSLSSREWRPSLPRQGRHSLCHLSPRVHGLSTATPTDSGSHMCGTCLLEALALLHSAEWKSRDGHRL